MPFKKLTPKQRECLAALRTLGSFVITGYDAKPIKALKKRGLAKIQTIDGVRHAVLKLNKAQRRAQRRRQRKGDIYINAAHAQHVQHFIRGT